MGQSRVGILRGVVSLEKDCAPIQKDLPQLNCNSMQICNTLQNQSIALFEICMISQNQYSGVEQKAIVALT
jgi:hypothetical protein